LIISANFKTYKNRKETKDYLMKLEENISKSSQQIIIFPPITSLRESTENIIVGTQNCYPVQNGAFTGEIGLSQLDEFHIKTILIGHSERRTVLNENQIDISSKFDFFSKEDFKIIYCIGETLETRQKGETELFKFLESQFIGINLEYKNIIIAYEPIWAIGTGITPTPEEINSTLKWIKYFTKRDVIYGGSVKTSNIEDILSLEYCDGVLVGSASLNVDDFSEMIQIADNLETTK